MIDDIFQKAIKPSYLTDKGRAFCGDSLSILPLIKNNSIDLAITSPPFALQREKEYGNKSQEEYVDWLMQFTKIIYNKLTESGSFVLDMGGAYMKGAPVRSLYNYRTLIKLCDEIGFFLAEEFFWFNPSKLPSPIEWVNKKKIRVKDSVNTVWWLSKTKHPKADVRKVLTPYSERMLKLLEDPEKYYKPKNRPSGHSISNGFAKNNGGAIPSNLLSFPNSESNSQYLRGCNLLKIKAHPARFPAKLPEFFIKLLTDTNDIVLDFFAGSNTTGMVAEELDRRWVAIDERVDYIASSVFRFLKNIDDEELKSLYLGLLHNKIINIKEVDKQKTLCVYEKLVKIKRKSKRFNYK